MGLQWVITGFKGSTEPFIGPTPPFTFISD